VQSDSRKIKRYLDSIRRKKKFYYIYMNISIAEEATAEHRAKQNQLSMFSEASLIDGRKPGR